MLKFNVSKRIKNLIYFLQFANILKKRTFVP